MIPRRIQLRRTKGWRKPEGARVVTRATIFGNPWALARGAPLRTPRYPERGPEGLASMFNPSGMRVLATLPCPHAESAEAVVALFDTWLSGVGLGGLPNNLTDIGRVKWRTGMLARRKIILDRLPELRGRDLACFCALDAPCHADVLLRLANKGRSLP
ncbi:MAG: DUF4326 domain-containing protein [Pseudomonadota bacterium]